MNLKDYYTEDQTAEMLSISKATLRKRRVDLGAERVGQSWFYNRRMVEDYAYSNLEGDEVAYYENIRDKIAAYAVSSSNPPEKYETYKVDTDMYVPIREVYHLWPYSRQAISYILQSDKHRLHRMKVAGAWFYRKEDLKNYMLEVTSKKMQREEYPHINEERLVMYHNFQEWQNAVENW